MNVSQFTHLPIKEYFVCLDLLVIMNKATLNIQYLGFFFNHSRFWSCSIFILGCKDLRINYVFN